MRYGTLGAFAIVVAWGAHARGQDSQTPIVPASPAAESQAPQRPPIYGIRADWFIEPYCYARFDAIEDSTQSFEDGIQPNLIARAGTYKGDHRRTILTGKDSRLGLFVGAPSFESIKSSAQVELDFYGLVPTDARRS